MKDRTPLPLIPSRIQEIYDSLPTVECKGLCWRDCSIILMAPVERERMIAARGKGEAFVGPKGLCPMLDPRTHRCVVHQYRPLICRLYGVAMGMLCPHNCVVSGVVTFDEAHALMEEVEKLGGGLDTFLPLRKKGLRPTKTYRMSRTYGRAVADG